MLRRLRALPLFSEALVALLCARVRLWRRPLPIERPCVNRNRTSSPDPRRIAWAVGRAAAFVPQATCLVRALAAQQLLHRYGHPADLHIGVANSPQSGFAAHAWIEHQGTVLIGRTQTQYAPLLRWGAAS